MADEKTCIKSLVFEVSGHHLTFQLFDIVFSVKLPKNLLPKSRMGYLVEFLLLGVLGLTIL